jgi:tetratricopeptide (TPR) repeat protein
MDCRKGWWLGLGLVIGGIGCKSQGTMPNASVAMPVPQTVAIDVVKEKELPKRPVPPSVSVAYGVFQEREAEDPNRTPVEKEQLRDQARRAYQAVLQTEPNNLIALQALARLYTNIQDHDRAIATYQRALKAHPNEASLWFDLGSYQSQCKEWAPAVESLRQALTLDPENHLYANRLGYCLARAGRFDESLVCFQQAVGPAPAHYNVARMQLHMKQEEAAKQNLRLALQIDPQHKESRDLLAQLDASGVQQVGLQVPIQAAPVRPVVKVGFEE